MDDKLRKLFRNPTSKSYSIFFYLATHQEEDFLYKSILSKALRIKYTSLNYWIIKFQERGLIDNHFRLTSKGNRLFEFLWKGKDIQLLRAHNIQLRFTLSMCPADYIEKYSDCIFTEFTNKKFRGLKGEIKLQWCEIGIMIYSRKKIVCVLKDIFGETDEDIAGALCEMVPSIELLIEKRFPGIKISGCFPARIQTSHIAYLDSIMAKQFALDGFTYEGKNIAVDASHGEYEIELTNPKNNLNVIGFIKEVETMLSEESEV
jgi:hypothetical protein